MTCCTEFELIEDFYAATDGERIYDRLLREQNWPDNHYIVAGRQFILSTKEVASLKRNGQ